MRRITILLLIAATLSIGAPVEAAGEPATMDAVLESLGEIQKSLEEMAKDPLKNPPAVEISAALLFGESAPEPFVLSVRAGTLRFTLVDLIPTAPYAISEEVVSQADPVLPVPPGKKRVLAQSCAALKAAANTVWAASDEEAVAVTRHDLQRLVVTGGCTDQKTLDLAQKTIQATKWGRSIELTIAPGDAVDFRIRRNGEERVLRIVGPEPSRLFPSAGFLFFREGDDAFVTRARDDGKFEIFAETDRRDWDAGGLALFNWRMQGQRGGPRFSWGLSAGVGFSSDDPSVLIGIHGMVGPVGLVAGVAMREEARLKGRYRAYESAEDPGTLVDSALDADQLVEKTFQESFFLGVSLRFDGTVSWLKSSSPATTTENDLGSK